MTECTHPPGRQLYTQLNVSRDPRITVADLLGGINPYVWRIEYCGECGFVFETYGEVPQRELEPLRARAAGYQARQAKKLKEAG